MAKEFLRINQQLAAGKHCCVIQKRKYDYSIAIGKYIVERRPIQHGGSITTT